MASRRRSQWKIKDKPKVDTKTKFIIPDTYIYQGTIVKHDMRKGFGFIRMSNGSEDIFFHRNNVISKQADLKLGTLVYFQMTADNHHKNGRTNAINVTVAYPSSKTESNSRKQQYLPVQKQSVE